MENPHTHTPRWPLSLLPSAPVSPRPLTGAGYWANVPALRLYVFCLFTSAMDKNTAQGRSPAQVAQAVLAAVGRKQKDVVLADLQPSLAIYLRTLAPGLFFRLMASRARKEHKAKGS